VGQGNSTRGDISQSKRGQKFEERKTRGREHERREYNREAEEQTRRGCGRERTTKLWDVFD
jgi:hypothetical protein